MFYNYDLYNYLNIKLSYLKDLLSSEYPVYCYTRKNCITTFKQVINWKVNEHYLYTPEGKALQQIFIRQQNIRNRIKELESLIRSFPKKNKILSYNDFKNVNNLNSCRHIFGEWEDLRIAPNEHDNKKHHEHNREDFDSKAEVSIAEVYELLNIPYKHSVVIKLDDFYIKADFVPYIEETGDYYIHEHIGMDIGRRYLNNTISKYEQFLKKGLIIGKDVLMTYENEDNFSDKIYYINCILMILNNLLPYNHWFSAL